MASITQPARARIRPRKTGPGAGPEGPSALKDPFLPPEAILRRYLDPFLPPRSNPQKQTWPRSHLEEVLGPLFTPQKKPSSADTWTPFYPQKPSSGGTWTPPFYPQKPSSKGTSFLPPRSHPQEVAWTLFTPQKPLSGGTWTPFYLPPRSHLQEELAWTPFYPPEAILRRCFLPPRSNQEVLFTLRSHPQQVWTPFYLPEAILTRYLDPF